MSPDGSTGNRRAVAPFFPRPGSAAKDGRRLAAEAPWGGVLGGNDRENETASGTRFEPWLQGLFLDHESSLDEFVSFGRRGGVKAHRERWGAFRDGSGFDGFRVAFGIIR